MPPVSTQLVRRLRRIRNLDGVILSIAASLFLFLGELSNPLLRTYIEKYVTNQPNVAFEAIALVLVVLGYTSAFGSFLALVTAILFSRNEISRGRFFLGLGIGLSLIGLISKLSAAILAADPSFLIWLGGTLTGLGVLTGIATQIVMGHHAMELKKRLRKLRKLREHHEKSERAKERRRHPLLPDH